MFTLVKLVALILYVVGSYTNHMPIWGSQCCNFSMCGILYWSIKIGPHMRASSYCHVHVINVKTEKGGVTNTQLVALTIHMLGY